MNLQELRVHSATHTKASSWWIYDAKGIPLRRVCEACEAEVRASYNPAIFDRKLYAEVVDEQIEEDCW